MKTFILKRILQMIPVMLGLAILIFSLSRMIPGDSIKTALGPDATQEQVNSMRENLGLNDPLYMQFFRYVEGIFQGDLGESLRTKRNVMDDLIETFPATLELTTFAMFIAILFGVPIGVISAIRKDKWADHATRIVALSGVAIPRFYLGIVLQIIFAYWLSILPIVGRGDIVPTTITGLRILDSLLTLNFPALWNSVTHIILPSVALAVGTLAQIMRLTRSNMINQMRKDYVLAAKAYGMPKIMIVYKYMLKNAFTSTLTIIGLSYGYLLGNAFLVEAVFGWPGMAQYGVQAVIFKDFNAIVGVTLVIGVVFLITNLIIDILYGYLDPRIKYD